MLNKQKMHVFQEGQQYALSTKDESNISLFFVKLTDSALQSIEMYLDSKGDSSLKPTIQFQDNSGTISLPINDRKHNYGFSLSNIETDGLQSSFYCFQHTCERSLKSLGIMLNRMHIHAKEDSYEQTKCKMAAADKEQKSFRTKEIKPKGTHLSHKFKRPELFLSSEKCYPAAKKPEPVNLNPENKFYSCSAVSRQPIRRRIIHILAIKPYKKPELLLRLIREGIADRDKKNLNAVLANVGTLKGNVYNLAINLWNEVQENWEFCTKEEFRLIQRRKQQFLKLSTEKEVPSSEFQNNCSVIQNISSEPIILENEPFNKKRRISHSGPKISDQVISVISSGSNTSKRKLPVIDNFKNSPDTHLQVNGNCNDTGLKNKTDSLVNCGKDFLSTCKLGKNSEDHIYSQNHISGPSHDMSSKKQTVCNFKIDESKHKNLKKVQPKAFVNNNHFRVPQIGTFIPFVTESDNHSKVQVNNHLANSEYKGEKSRRYEYSVTNLCVNNKPSHTNTSMVAGSKVISPVSYSNSSDSSLCSKDSKNDVGYVEDTRCIVDLYSEMDYLSSLQMYSTIDSKKQRSQYAKEFNIQYEEYLKLHAQMRHISERFIYLENCLLQCEEDSNECKKIRAEIQKENSCTLQNSDYISAWKKFNFLQSKLSLIKKVIKEYDTSQGRES